MEWLKINADGEVEFVAEEIRLIPEIQALYTLNYNKGKNDADGRKRYRALAEVKYLYLAYSPKSPYRDYSEIERKKEAILDCAFGEHWVESPELQALIPKFLKGNQNKIVRLLGTVERFVEKFEAHLNKINLEERTDGGMMVHKPKDIMDTLERMPRLADTLIELERQAKTDSIRKVSSKGDHELGWMALGTNLTKTTRDGDSGYREEGEGEV